MATPAAFGSDNWTKAARDRATARADRPMKPLRESVAAIIIPPA
jgi:hypothetical protein